MDLTELAARWGIEPSYLDIQGRRRDADEDTIRRIVEALSARGNQPASGLNEQESPRSPIRATGGNAGSWRCSFTVCARAATGATAISAISRTCWKSSPALAAPASASIRCTRSSMTGRHVPAARIRRTADCFSTRSISTSRRSRNSTVVMPHISPPTSPGCATPNWSITAPSRRSRLQRCARHIGVSPRTAARAPPGFRSLSAGARPRAGMLRGIRDPAGATFRRMVGMA
jgi:hypothetical protein